MTDLIHRSAQMFARDVAKHQMTILHEDGLYRHVRFARPNTGMYHFDLITWPGYLTICGDMESYTFRRLDDMFQFFRSGTGWNHDTINPHYWSEKLVDGRERAEKYSRDLFEQVVKETFVDVVRNGDAPAGLGKAIREEILNGSWDTEYEVEAREALERFEFKGFRFSGAWEWDLKDYDWHFLRACHAIQWGITQYDAARSGQRAPERELVAAVPQPAPARAPRLVTVEPTGGVL